MNLYNWNEGRYVIHFIVGNKYCTVLADHAEGRDVFEAVKTWHEETDPNGSMVPFVIVSDMFVTADIFDWYLENELAQTTVNV